MRNMLGLAVLAAVISPLGACSSQKSTQVSADDARDLLIDRNWLDRMPETDRDHLFVYRFVPNMGGGVFQDRTLYKGTFELFSFSVKDNAITFKLHETKTEITSAYTIETVEGPAPFDLKLTITDDPRGPKVYFGMKSETDRDGTGLDRLLATKR